MIEIRTVSVTPQSINAGQTYNVTVEVVSRLSITDLLNVSINKLKTISINALKGGG